MNMSARTFRSAALAVGVFAVCQSVQPYAKAADENRITTKQEFTEALVGRKTSNQYGWAMLHEDASITGEFGDKELTGTWAWEGEYLCRAGKLGKKKIPRDCRVVIVSGTKLTVIGKKGKGKKRTYRIHEPE